MRKNSFENSKTYPMDGNHENHDPRSHEQKSSDMIPLDALRKSLSFDHGASKPRNPRQCDGIEGGRKRHSDTLLIKTYKDSAWCIHRSTANV